MSETREGEQVPEHGVPPGVAKEDATGYPTSDRHRTEHAVLPEAPPEGESG